MNQPDTFNWKVYRPLAALAPYIESYRVVHTQGGGTQQVNGWLFASNALQLVFKLEAAHTSYNVSNDTSSAASCFVVGPLEKPAVGTAVGAISAIHVIFRPGMAGVFLHYPIDELANAAIALDDLYSKSPLEIASMLSECPNDGVRIAALENGFYVVWQPVEVLIRLCSRRCGKLSRHRARCQSETYSPT